MSFGHMTTFFSYAVYFNKIDFGGSMPWRRNGGQENCPMEALHEKINL